MEEEAGAACASAGWDTGFLKRSCVCMLERSGFWVSF